VILVDFFLVTFFLLPLGLALLSTSVLAYFDERFLGHAILFFLLSIVFIWLAQKFLQKKQTKPNSEVGVVGKWGVIEEAFVSYQNPGKVRIFDELWDIEWKEETKDQHLLKPGDRVKVVDMQGNKVIIRRHH
jgi:membrane protein implicated in regulation of membrane protease activity